MKAHAVLVVGGSGFIGRHLVAALAAAGIRVTVPSRRRERAKHLILLPTVDVVEADVMAGGVLERLCAGKQAVYNLVGILHGRRGRRDERGQNEYGPDFARMHVELPQAIVAACRASGARRLLHVSALGAAPDAPSEYLRSKAIGEQAVLAAEDLDVTVFRPSVVSGPRTGFSTALPCSQSCCRCSRCRVRKPGSSRCTSATWRARCTSRSRSRARAAVPTSFAGRAYSP